MNKRIEKFNSIYNEEMKHKGSKRDIDRIYDAWVDLSRSEQHAVYEHVSEKSPINLEMIKCLIVYQWMGRDPALIGEKYPELDEQ